MSKETGGPAFPVPDSEYQIQDTGMMLRDYFAAKAMAAWLSTFSESDTHPSRLSDGGKGFAAMAYQLADAMLAARASNS